MGNDFSILSLHNCSVEELIATLPMVILKDIEIYYTNYIQLLRFAKAVRSGGDEWSLHSESGEDDVDSDLSKGRQTYFVISHD